MKNILDDQVAIVTGATGGIGSKIAKELYDLGAKLVLTGRNIYKLNKLKEELIINGHKNEDYYSIRCVSSDLKDAKTSDLITENAISAFGRIDILVNNAAMTDARLFLKTDVDFMNEMLEINFLKPVQLMQKTIPYMIQNKYGRIINITSLASTMGNEGMSAYAASKAALESISKVAATEYARRGITINCIAPGLIDTNALGKVSKSNKEFIQKQIPTQRYGTPEEIAGLVGFLASKKASYINGQTIHVNGGLYR